MSPHQISYTCANVSSNLVQLHFDNVKTKVTKSKNVIRSSSGVSWGSDPKILRIVHSAIVRSHFDCASRFFASATTTRLDKVDKLFNHSLCYLMGHMKSTAIHVILSESAEVPLKIWLSSKFLLKDLAHSNADVINLISSLCNAAILP